MTTQPSVLQAATEFDDPSGLEPAMIASVPDLILREALPMQMAATSSSSKPTDPAAVPTIQTPGLSEVYEQAGVSVPKHGFSILKIAEMLGSVHIRDLAPEAKRAAVMMALEVSNVQLNDVIEDAARRERALNDFETRQQQAFQGYKAAKQQHNQETQAEIDRLIEKLRLRIETNDKELVSEKVRLDEWRGKKREEERRIRNAVSHFGGSSETNSGPASAQRPSLHTEASDRSSETSPATENGAGRGAATRPSLGKR